MAPVTPVQLQASDRSAAVGEPGSWAVVAPYRPLLLVLATALLLSGCGSSSSAGSLQQPSPTPSRSTSDAVASESPVTVSSPTTSIASTSAVVAGPASRPAIRNGDVVFCDNLGQNVAGIGPIKGKMTIGRLVTVGVAPELVYSLDLGAAMQGWTDGGESGFCRSPLSWSADFSKLLVAGRPPGASSTHIAVFDMATGSLTDLTAPRQKAGFSDVVLWDSKPRFLADSSSDRITFGSNVVSFIENGSPKILRLSNPEIATPAKTVEVHGRTLLAGHLEQEVDFGDSFHNRASPDGRYIVPVDGSITNFARAVTPDTALPFSCPNMTGGFKLVFLLGWADSRHAVISDDEHADLITIGPKLACSSLIPSTAKQISHVLLTPDGKTVMFTAQDANGDRVYSVPVLGTGREPVLATYPPPSNSTVYYPGNY
jgi:hypothetical protein